MWNIFPSVITNDGLLPTWKEHRKAEVFAKFILLYLYSHSVDYFWSKSALVELKASQ